MILQENAKNELVVFLDDSLKNHPKAILHKKSFKICVMTGYRKGETHHHSLRNFSVVAKCGEDVINAYFKNL